MKLKNYKATIHGSFGNQQTKKIKTEVRIIVAMFPNYKNKQNRKVYCIEQANVFGFIQYIPLRTSWEPYQGYFLL